MASNHQATQCSQQQMIVLENEADAKQPLDAFLDGLAHALHGLSGDSKRVRINLPLSNSHSQSEQVIPHSFIIPRW
jgi:hypothetical protein